MAANLFGSFGTMGASPMSKSPNPLQPNYTGNVSMSPSFTSQPKLGLPKQISQKQKRFLAIRSKLKKPGVPGY